MTGIWYNRGIMQINVSSSRHSLCRENGTPFFYLGDTAWELFHRLDRDEADFYLKTRATQGFTVIQAVLLAEFDGVRTPNAYGRLPLVDADPARPDDSPGGFWEHADYIVRRANELGLVMGLLPTWGDKWNKAWGAGPEIFDRENARAYGRWLGSRYRDDDIIWILGGDRPVESDAHRAILQSMAEGLREGDGGRHPITFHPAGGCGSSEAFPDAPWLDFHMRQNGHGADYEPNYAKTLDDYNLAPTKPVIDGEPLYEGHPLSFRPDELGHSVAADVRRPLYWDLFHGACGHTYGHHSIWQFWAPGREPVNRPLLPWREALFAPGATQMAHARRLVETIGAFDRMPDDSLLMPEPFDSAVPGHGIRRFAACRDPNGRYILAYAPVGMPFRLRLDALKGKNCHARWMDPRTGEFVEIGEIPTADPHAFMPPTPGELTDWVLVAELAAR